MLGVWRRLRTLGSERYAGSQGREGVALRGVSPPASEARSRRLRVLALEFYARGDRRARGRDLELTRQERIAFLLEHLEDVRHGVRDRGTSGEAIPLMCAAWNSPSYRELERLLPRLRSEHPPLAWHLSQTYFAPRRRVLSCPRCSWQTHSWASLNFHRHAGRNVALVPRVLRVVPAKVRPELVGAAIAWLDESWQGGVFVPDALLPLVSTA